MSEHAQRGGEVVQLTAFRVGGEEYVVDIMRVREIIRPLPVTPVRKGPKFVEGVINLRGAVIPVIDLRRRFDLAAEAHRERRVIILVVDGRTLGLVVDGVTEVVRVPRRSIRQAPCLLDPSHAPYFLGVCHFRQRTLILLNVKNVVTSEDEIDAEAAAALMRSAK